MRMEANISIWVMWKLELWICPVVEGGKWNGNHIKLVCKTIYLILQIEVIAVLTKKKYYALGEAYIFFFLVLIIWTELLNVFFNSIGANHGGNILEIYGVRWRISGKGQS